MRKVPRLVRRLGWVAVACGLLTPVLMTATQASAAPGDGLPHGLLSSPVTITNNNGLRYGEPEIAVNPRNPDNIVYYVMSQQLTYACEAARNPNYVNGRRDRD